MNFSYPMHVLLITVGKKDPLLTRLASDFNAISCTAVSNIPFIPIFFLSECVCRWGKELFLNVRNIQ